MGNLGIYGKNTHTHKTKKVTIEKVLPSYTSANAYFEHLNKPM